MRQHRASRHAERNREQAKQNYPKALFHTVNVDDQFRLSTGIKEKTGKINLAGKQDMIKMMSTNPVIITCGLLIG
jgi:hypothetical protein